MAFFLGMTVEYSCIFGISAPIKGLIVGEQVNALFDHLTIVTVHGKKRSSLLVLNPEARPEIYLSPMPSLYGQRIGLSSII